mgnify:FL=1
MTTQCRCPYPHHTPTPIGTSLGGGVVGNWAPLPGTELEANSAPPAHELKQCECGCNTYQGTSPIGPTDVDSLGIPVLPITLEYVDDDEPSDDHEYVSIKITELADMTSALKSCTCQDH